MKPETCTKIKIGDAIVDAQDMDRDEKIAFIEFAIHLAAPRIAQILAGELEKVVKKPTENDNLLFDMPPTLTVQEVASFLRTSPSTIYEMCRIYHGKFFPHFKIGNRYKIPRDKFIEWLNNGGLDNFKQQVASGDSKRLNKPIKQQLVKEVGAFLKKEKKVVQEPVKPEKKSRLNKKEAAEFLNISTSKMLSMLKDKKIFHFRIENSFIIPTIAIETYVDTKGEATWNDQIEIFSKYEPRISDLNILSLPTEKPFDATEQIKCKICGTMCWHNKNTDDMAEYEHFCYKCVLEKEGIIPMKM